MLTTISSKFEVLSVVCNYLLYFGTILEQTFIYDVDEFIQKN